MKITVIMMCVLTSMVSFGSESRLCTNANRSIEILGESVVRILTDRIPPTPLQPPTDVHATYSTSALEITETSKVELGREFISDRIKSHYALKTMFKLKDGGSLKAYGITTAEDGSISDYFICNDWR